MPPIMEVLDASESSAESYLETTRLKESPKKSSAFDFPEGTEGVTRPGEHDVLLGRGGGTNNHAGNVKFRKLVNEHKMRYLACSKVDKPKVAREVVQLWRKMDPPGRFLARKDDSLKGPGSVKNANNIWYEVGDKKAREKASQCLRERTPDVMPYIKKLREQQDAITEHGVSMVQHQLQMQEGKKHGQGQASRGMTESNFPSPTSAIPVPNANTLHRSGSLPNTPDHVSHADFSRRTSCPTLAQGTPQPSPLHTRHTSLPPMGQPDFTFNMPSEEEFVSDMTELEFQQKMVMMQQQMQMQQMQMQRIQQQRQMQMQQQRQHQLHSPAMTQGYGAAYTVTPDTYKNSNTTNNHDSFGSIGDPLPLAEEAHLPKSPPTHAPKSVLKAPCSPNKRSREDGQPLPDKTSSSTRNGMKGAQADNELTLEEYRQQLEQYMNNNVLQQSNHDCESDLEDDWEKEKEKAYREDKESRKRGVGRNVSGMSFMSAQTTKSNLTMMSGLSMLADLDDFREHKMSMTRSVGSNLSLMSELTDISQTIDDLCLDD